jgi:hypothetical protein
MPAPKGNTNALKHGLYAKQFNDDERAGLKKMHLDDHRHEVNALRTVGAELYRLFKIQLSLPVVDVSKAVALSNAIEMVAVATGTSARTHNLLNGTDEPVGDALSEALGNVPFFEDDRID